MIKKTVLPLIACLTFTQIVNAQESDYVITTQIEDKYAAPINKTGLYIAPTGRLPLAGDSTVTNNIIVDGGSLDVLAPQNKEGETKVIYTLTQTNADDEQALTIRNGGSVSLGGDTKGTIAGKADLINGSLSMSASKEQTTSLTIGKDYTSSGSSLSTSTSEGYIEMNVNGNMSLEDKSTLSMSGGIINLGGNMTASDSTINLTGGEKFSSTMNIAGTGSIKNSSLTVNKSSMSFGNNLSILDSTLAVGGTLSAKDISVTNTPISLAGSIIATNGDIVLDNSDITADHGRLSASGTIDFKNGTHTFYGNAGTTLSATQTNVASGVQLDLGAGSVVEGILNVNGNINLVETKTDDLNVSGTAAENGKIDLKWNNFIDGNFNLTDNATMTMTQTTDHNSILTITNGDMNATNSSVNMDVGVIKNADGSVNFNDNSSLSLRIAGKPTDEKDTYGHIEAHEINISNNNTKLNVILDTGVLTKEEGQVDYTLFDADSVNGQFSEMIKNNRYTIVYKGNGIFGITEKTSAGDIVVGGDEENLDIRDMADAWLNEAFPSDSNGNEIQNVLNTLSQTPGMEQAYTDALNALSPDTTPIVTSLSATFNRQMANVIGARLEKMRAHSRYGYNRYNRGQPIFEKQDGLWVQGLTNKIDYTGSKAFDAKNNGVAAGADVELADGFKIGLGYSYTDTDANSIGRKTDVTTHLGAIYVDVNGDELYFNTLATYGRSQYEEKKDVFSLPVKAKYDVDFWGVQSILGYDPGAMRMGKYGMGTIMPEIGVRYMAIKKKGYTDSADQRVKDADANTLTGTLGAHYTLNYDFGNIVVYPDLKAAVTYDFIQDELESVVALPNDLAYRVKEERLDKLGVEVGAELGIKIAKTVDISLSYLGMFRKDYKDHTGFLNLKYHF